MKFHRTQVDGAFLIELESFVDERGSFARSFCAREFESHGMEAVVAQCNISTNRERGTLRGMHRQRAPHGEAKLVRCARGSMFDVALDLRRKSPTYLRHQGFKLSAVNGRMFYLPSGVHHGFLTLEDDVEVFYQMSNFYTPDVAEGVRYDDPAFGIEWPTSVRVISDRDAGYPDFSASGS